MATFIKTTALNGDDNIRLGTLREDRNFGENLTQTNNNDLYFFSLDRTTTVNILIDYNANGGSTAQPQGFFELVKDENRNGFLNFDEPVLDDFFLGGSARNSNQTGLLTLSPGEYIFAVSRNSIFPASYNVAIDVSNSNSFDDDNFFNDDSGLQIGNLYGLITIRDFDGNAHGVGNFNGDLAISDSYKYQGQTDVQGNGKRELVFTNQFTGRWATVEVDPLTGEADYSRFGSNGSTRVVGIYTDPLVDQGVVQKNSSFDSQRRFQNDLLIDNLELRASGDYDGDGFQELYWKTGDGTAYLRALMHGDGNIQYANYQSEQQMRDYLTSTGNFNEIQFII